MSVELGAPTTFWLELKVGSRVYTFDRMAGTTKHVMRLRPGNYRVRYRNDAEQSWRGDATLTVPPGTEDLALRWLGPDTFELE